MNLEEVKKFLGKTVHGSQGEGLGRLVGLTTNTRNEITAITVELGDGEFIQAPSGRLRIQLDSMMLLPDWKVAAEELRREMDVVGRRLRALDELYRAGEIQEEAYSDLRKQHEESIASLRQRKESIRNELVDRAEKLGKQLSDLENLLANNKMQHSSGDIDDTSYKVTSESIRSGLHRVTSEKKEIEEFIFYLEGDATKATQPDSTFQPKPPEEKKVTPPDVIFVKVRETE